MSSPATLPDDIDALKAMIAERDAMMMRLQGTIDAQQAILNTRTAEIAHLKLLIAKLQRQQYGRKSEKLDRQIEQLELRLEELVADEGVVDAQPAKPAPERKASERAPLPGHLPRVERILEP
jgi:chromosome segregation ATPase